MLDEDGEEIWTEETVWRRIFEPDPLILLVTARDLAEEGIDPSIPAVNPPGRVPAQLGMWLAIDDPGPVTATAYIGDFVWSRTTTARIVGTSFEMGNGDRVDCGGVGTPIPRLDGRLRRGRPLRLHVHRYR